MLGPSLLVAPVTAKGAETWPVYLPDGLWYDYWTNEPIQGGRWIDSPAPLDRIPLYVKAGSILPLGEVMPYIPNEKPTGFEQVTLLVYPGADGAFTLYEDDGVSLGYQRGECSTTRLVWNEALRSLTAEGASTLFPGIQRTFAVNIAGESTAPLNILYH